MPYTMLTIPERKNAPETKLNLKIIKKSGCSSWDREVMLLIPGGPGGNHSLYSEIEKDLSKFADLVIVDLRGCGNSDKHPVEQCTLENHIKDLQSVLRILNIPKPIILGTSYGAMVATGHAIAYPQIVHKLILASGAATGNFIEDAKKNLLKRGTEEQIKMGEVLWNGAFKNNKHFADFYQIMLPLYIHNRTLSSYSAPTSKSVIPYNVELVNYAFTGFLKYFDFCDELEKIVAPTLIFSGEKDWITDGKQAEILNSRICKSTLISLKNCGHFPWIDQPKRYFDEIAKFVSER